MVAVALSLQLAGCGPSYASMPPEDGALRSALVEAAHRAGACAALDLSDVFPGQWDRIAIIGPYTTNAEVAQMLGLSLDVQSVSAWNGNEGGSVLVLARAGEVVGWFLLPSSDLETANIEGVRGAGEATFVVAEAGPGFFQLLRPNASAALLGDCAAS